jgi:hypothetical protein
MTIVDGMVFVACGALAAWVSRAYLVPGTKTALSIPSEIWAANPVWLTCHWGSLLLRHTQPIAAVLTLAVLSLRILQPRPRLRLLVRQPGFTASVAASMAICIGGGLNVSTKTTFAPSLEAQGYALNFLFPRGFECGITVAACWTLLVLGRRWHSEHSWIDRLGMLLGFYWIAMIVALAPKI